MLKNKIFLGFLLLCGLFAACEKRKEYDPETQLQIDIAKIKKYVADSNIRNVVNDPSGMSYVILAQGTDPKPILSDSIYVYYKAKVVGARSTFQEVPITKPISLKLDTLIKGWRIGLPMIGKGGQIRMIIPSTLAYMDFQDGTSIPPFSVLDYTVTLVDINYKKPK
ncbi:FKBP-type peptidyl-prolyl cis-trans isomerase [Pedobacter caeni]|uniref:Peptidyl-prolyl cis-trans isomerase n=1 Tax=Pedobacter caeni TaxID=288992 RepID=A0A1M5NKZ4_9SPHI|nr:FKBP-type peptidyl-prolyl cis-trans isomerase [Pedobacter caeni]SHG89583.1 FKBP-type peptidyl-prolyl cis-trans isomerase FkpA [Pedobacter caeni]